VNWRFLERMMLKMGFSEGWFKWIRACIFESTMSVLVNGSPSEDFKVGRGLRQGDPLSPFLFLIAAEGLTALMNRAVELGKFKGYHVGGDIQFQILQFADDTILLGEGTWDNLWTIKTILRSFELVSGLKINFVKSNLYGINIDPSLLAAGSVFLSCRSDSLPFKFLGVPVGANPRRRETWKPIVEKMEKRLSMWSSRHLSYGGRITLINSVLSSLPLYFFSFFKAPKCIIQNMVRIQRNFLWGGSIDIKKICWINWDQICLPKIKGGLGIKNLELFNLALLSKWKWRLISENDALWSDLLRFRYGHLPSLVLGNDPIILGSKDSIWWKDINGRSRGLEDWFRPNVACNIGNGNEIAFWQCKWFGNQPFKDLYPNLYEKEVVQNVKVVERFPSEGMNGMWAWHWNSLLTNEELQQVNSLMELFVGLSLHHNHPDSWKWIPGATGVFSVKSCYDFLLDNNQVVVFDPAMLDLFKNLWRNDSPSKVLIFGWRLLLDRLPTKSALHRRGILFNSQDLLCVLCLQHVEDCVHLFCHCPFIKRVWELVSIWIGKNVDAENCPHVRNLFILCGSLFRYPKGGRTNHLFWLTTTWCVWKLRNLVVFNGAIPSVSSLMDDIKTYSWLWFSGRYARNVCIPFSVWCQDPMSHILSS
jgi:hypothetical protein